MKTLCTIFGDKLSTHDEASINCHFDPLDRAGNRCPAAPEKYQRPRFHFREVGDNNIVG